MSAMALTREQAEQAVERLRAYGQPQRLMILSHLQAGELTVGGIDAATGIGQPALSQQLAELRRAGLVATRRVSKQVFYRLADVSVAHCVRSIETQFGGAEAGPEPEGPAADTRAAGRPPQKGAAMFARVIREDSR
ncbi:metalloregulator ArsR/SmtB family transcription factor [Ancylobacter sp. GSK1Z-4-2]|nr:metalloregulator ArsR/SmtB family transcription factor [Ancylobacter mangrovi]